MLPSWTWATEGTECNAVVSVGDLMRAAYTTGSSGGVSHTKDTKSRSLLLGVFNFVRRKRDDILPSDLNRIAEPKKVHNV
jgi:hypothetical protein